MANVSLKRFGKNKYKKASCVMSGKIIPSKVTTKDGVAVDGTLAIGDVITIGSLPGNCVVTDAMIVVGSTVTGGTQTLKITVGSTDVIAAVAVGTAAAVKGGAVTRVATGTGADVKVTVGVAALTDGEFDVIVDYIEYERTVGEYNN